MTRYPRDRKRDDRPSADRGRGRADAGAGEADHRWPDLLPGGRAVLFTITTLTGGLDAAQVAVLDLQTGMTTIESPETATRTGRHLVP